VASGWGIFDGIMPWYDGPEWDDVAAEVFEDAKERVKQHAQDNALWEDRTGDARASLDTMVIHEGAQVSLVLFHGVEYGMWLETIQSGRFAIILPTLEEVAPQIFGEAMNIIAEARQGQGF